jgi:hypothetical protein
MKKVFLLAAAGLFLFASCKKDYTCECVMTTSINGVTVATSQPTSTSIPKSTKSNAESACNAMNTSTSTSSTGLVKNVCTLK